MLNKYSLVALTALFFIPVAVSADHLTVLGNGNAPILVSNTTTNRFDFTNDGLADYYVKAHFVGNENITFKVDYKVQDNCVDGSTYEDAKMKLGFSTTDLLIRDITWFTEDTIQAWTPWFKAKNNDANNLIDLIRIPDGKPIRFSFAGDDLIQPNKKNGTGSFIHRDSVKELDGQPGWEGSVLFKAEEGDYLMWSVHPGFGGEEECDTFTALAIPIFVNATSRP